jgi:hypothetical protein
MKYTFDEKIVELFLKLMLEEMSPMDAVKKIFVRRFALVSSAPICRL